MRDDGLSKLFADMASKKTDDMKYKASMNVAGELVNKLNGAKNNIKPMSYDDFCFCNEKNIIGSIKESLLEVEIPIGLYGTFIVNLEKQKESVLRHHYNRYKEILNEQ